MKNINFIKLFLVIILAVTWDTIIGFFLLSYVQKEGAQSAYATAASIPSVCNISVSDTEADAVETYHDIAEKYGEADGVENISILYGNLDLSCSDLEEQSGRTTTLQGWIYEKQYEKCITDGTAPGEDEPEILIPEYFMPYDYGGYNGKNYLDGKTLVGKTITITGQKAVYDEKEDFTENLEETWSVQVKVSGTYDNIKAGMTGERIFYSSRTYIKLLEERMGMDEQSAADYTDHQMSTKQVMVYASDMEAKEALMKKLEEDYEGCVYDGLISMDITSYRDLLDERNTMFGISLIACVVFTVIAVILTLFLMKKPGISYAAAWLCFAAGAGMAAGAVQTLGYVKRENAAAAAVSDDISRFLQYPAFPAYAAIGAAICLFAVSIVILIMKWRRKKHAGTV